MAARRDIGFLQRTDQQFHWLNEGYGSFEDFLAALAARKRKAIRKERREALGEGIEIEWMTGRDLTEAHFDAFFAFYMDTGSRKWGSPYLTRRCFSLLGATMADRILLVLAKRAGRYIAGALNFIGEGVLYGRYWGAIEDHPCLHFEVCYYQAIEFAIAHRLARVEAGAQGAHKLARGYLPSETYSAHYIADPGLRSRRGRVSEARAACGCTRDRAPRRGSALSPKLILRLTARPQGLEMTHEKGSGRRAMAYDENNIFAKVLRGEIPCHKIYEDEDTPPSSTSCPARRATPSSSPRRRRATCSTCGPRRWPSSWRWCRSSRPRSRMP
jgi:hypothetical protein